MRERRKGYSIVVVVVVVVVDVVATGIDG